MLSPRELEALRVRLPRARHRHAPAAHRASCRACCRRCSPTAARARRAAGFDGVELHFAHAYTMASFLSALNTRDDGYGGARENRVRLPLEVVRAVRAARRHRVVVGCRYLGDECIEGGNRVDDAAYFGVELARAGLDFLSLSRAASSRTRSSRKVGWAAYPYTGPSGYECMPTMLLRRARPVRAQRAASPRRSARRCAPPGFDDAGRRRRRHPRFRAGRSDPRARRRRHRRAARQSLADPGLVPQDAPRAAAPRSAAATFTNYCEGLDQQHKQVTCKLWDRVELDAPGVTRSSPTASAGSSRRRSRSSSNPPWTSDVSASGTRHSQDLTTEEGLQRRLTPRQLSMIAIGSAIGVGLFLGSTSPSALRGPASSSPMSSARRSLW